MQSQEVLRAAFLDYCFIASSLVQSRGKGREAVLLKIYDYNGVKNVAGERIHQRRTTLRISQADLSARMQVRGVTIEREAISKIETGDRFITDYELMTFAEVLGVSMDWLTGKD